MTPMASCHWSWMPWNRYCQLGVGWVGVVEMEWEHTQRSELWLVKNLASEEETSSECIDKHEACNDLWTQMLGCWGHLVFFAIPVAIDTVGIFIILYPMGIPPVFLHGTGYADIFILCKFNGANKWNVFTSAQTGCMYNCFFILMILHKNSTVPMMVDNKSWVRSYFLVGN